MNIMGLSNNAEISHDIIFTEYQAAYNLQPIIRFVSYMTEPTDFTEGYADVFKLLLLKKRGKNKRCTVSSLNRCI